MAWKAKIKDSKGYPIKGVKVVLGYGTTEVAGADSIAVTGANGYAKKAFTIPSCTGDYTRIHTENYGSYAGTYKTKFDIGGWKMTVPDTDPADGIGVGGSNVPYVNIAHICDQDLQ